MLIIALLVELNCNWTPNSNCLLHKDSKLFVLLDLKEEQAYEVETENG
jgi:hypothetical protein